MEARIRVANVEDAVVAPASALFREEGQWTAFALKEGKARKVKLETGARTPDYVQIGRGLVPGDQVVLYPSDQIADGVELAASPGQ